MFGLQSRRWLNSCFVARGGLVSHGLCRCMLACRYGVVGRVRDVIRCRTSRSDDKNLHSCVELTFACDHLSEHICTQPVRSFIRSISAPIYFINAAVSEISRIRYIPNSCSLSW